MSRRNSHHLGHNLAIYARTEDTKVRLTPATVTLKQTQVSTPFVIALFFGTFSTRARQSLVESGVAIGSLDKLHILLVGDIFPRE
jgi:ribosomal protein L18E